MKNEEEKVSVEIKEVLFLTPARIKAIINGEEKIFLASVDIINKKVFVDNDDYLSETVFSHLDNINILPENFFAASDDIVADAVKMEKDRNTIYEKVSGDLNE
jgi:hypothetical protein